MPYERRCQTCREKIPTDRPRPYCTPCEERYIEDEARAWERECRPDIAYQIRKAKPADLLRIPS